MGTISSSRQKIFPSEDAFDLLEDQTNHLDRNGVAELLVADVSPGMQLEVFGETHGPAAFLGVQAARDTIDQIHAGLGSDATAEG